MTDTGHSVRLQAAAYKDVLWLKRVSRVPIADILAALLSDERQAVEAGKPPLYGRGTSRVGER